jgi:tRNA(Arg) A34 adenosine deaminase TadA
MIDLDKIIQRTLQLAESAGENDEGPVGAVIYDDDGNIVAESENKTRREHSVSFHAELAVIAQMGFKKGSENLSEYHLATSLEPCAMCAQAIAWAKLKTIVIACDDEKSGGVLHNAKVFEHSHHKPEVIYLESYKEQSANLLKQFFKKKRKK